jgi:hypothetical protein
MFSEGGQPCLSRMARGGGKGGGGGQQYYPPPPPLVLTDPVTGKSFVQQTQIGPYGGIENVGPSPEDQLNAEIDARLKDAQVKSDAATTAANTTAATNESNFQTSKTNAYNDALAAITHTFQLQGLDPNKYMASDILPALTSAQNSIKDLDPNPSAAFAPNLGTTILNNIQSGARTTGLNTLNQTFTPDYVTNALPDSSLNDLVTSTVNQQFDPLGVQLQNAQKRGLLSGPGYDAALAKLNDLKTGATSQVQSLGSNILAGDRSKLTDYITGARTDANNLLLGSSFDPSSYAKTAGGMVSTDLSGLGGALSSAVGDTKFANIDDLINAGGAAQGAQNPTAAAPGGPGPTTAAGGAPLSPAYQAPDALAKQPRGLGDTGAF